MKVYVSLSILLVLTGCSSLTKNKDRRTRPAKVQYSDEVEREFSRIESEQDNLSRYYRELRQKDWENYKKGTKKRHSFYQITPKDAPRSAQKKIKKKTPSYSDEQIREFQVEIGQNLSYYCMKNRKSKRFDGKEDCIAYTKDTLLKCEDKYSRQYGRVITRCLKKSLGI